MGSGQWRRLSTFSYDLCKFWYRQHHGITSFYFLTNSDAMVNHNWFIGRQKLSRFLSSWWEWKKVLILLSKFLAVQILRRTLVGWIFGRLFPFCRHAAITPRHKIDPTAVAVHFDLAFPTNYRTVTEINKALYYRTSFFTITTTV